MGAWEGIWLGMQAVEDAKYKNVQLDLQERKMALLEKETEEAARLAQMDTLFKNFSTSRGYNYKKSSPNSGVEIETGIERDKTIFSVTDSENSTRAFSTNVIKASLFSLPKEISDEFDSL